MGESTAFLFQPDELLSAQFWEKFGSKGVLEPEKMLMLAVLQDGIESFQKHLAERDARFREAEEWILEEDNDAPFSFESLCKAVGWDPKFIRRELLRWRDEQPAAPRRESHPHVKKLGKRRDTHGAKEEP